MSDLTSWSALRPDAAPFQPSLGNSSWSTAVDIQGCQEIPCNTELSTESTTRKIEYQSERSKSSHKSKKVVLPADIFSFSFSKKSDEDLLRAHSHRSETFQKSHHGGKGKLSVRREQTMTKSEFVQAK